MDNLFTTTHACSTKHYLNITKRTKGIFILETYQKTYETITFPKTGTKPIFNNNNHSNTVETHIYETNACSKTQSLITRKCTLETD